MLQIAIGQTYIRSWTDLNDQKLINDIKSHLAAGDWTPQTEVKVFEDGRVIDSGVIDTFFNVY